MITLHPLARGDGARVAHIAVHPDQRKFSGTVAEALADDPDRVDLHMICRDGAPVGLFKVDRGYARDYLWGGEPNGTPTRGGEKTKWPAFAGENGYGAGGGFLDGMSLGTPKRRAKRDKTGGNGGGQSAERCLCFSGFVRQTPNKRFGV